MVGTLDGSLHLPIERKRVLLLGATGTIGRATARALVRRGYDVVCFVRPRAGFVAGFAREDKGRSMGTAAVRFGHVTDRRSFALNGICGEKFDAVISCMTSRSGVPRDAWAIDYQAHVDVLEATREAGIAQFVLLSAICVQKPLLAFQQAKLAFEKVLASSDVTYSIVRPTAFFKSLSGQVSRVKQGKPFLLFGDGTLTACKPIGDDDLGGYLVDCLEAGSLRNRVLPVGGPGEAVTPREQGEEIFRLLGRKPRFKHVPVGLLDAVVWGLGAAGRIVPALADKAELARIGRYYATESMLVLDPATGRYDAAATPSIGSERLFDYYARLIAGEVSAERGEHAVF